jgi:hypothetical protein
MSVIFPIIFRQCHVVFFRLLLNIVSRGLKISSETPLISSHEYSCVYLKEIVMTNENNEKTKEATPVRPDAAPAPVKTPDAPKSEPSEPTAPPAKS